MLKGPHVQAYCYNIFLFHQSTQQTSLIDETKIKDLSFCLLRKEMIGLLSCWLPAP